MVHSGALSSTAPALKDRDRSPVAAGPNAGAFPERLRLLLFPRAADGDRPRSSGVQFPLVSSGLTLTARNARSASINAVNTRIEDAKNAAPGRVIGALALMK